MKSPKKLIAAKLKTIKKIYDSFPVSGQFDAVALIDVESLSEIKDTSVEIVLKHSHLMQGLKGCVPVLKP